MALCCNSLHDILEAFSGVSSIREEKQKYMELACQFEKIAKGVFFGGCFQINDIRRIYPLEIEFYYHEESPNGLKDPVMYHTSDRTKKTNLGYYPLGSLNFHVSGMDVTFEKESDYRASFLIREYQVLDWVDGEWVPRKETNGNHPTYIYEDMLMGFPIFEGISIQWITEQENEEDWRLFIQHRINVAEYQKDDDGKYVKDKKGNYIKEEISKAMFGRLSQTDQKNYFKYSGKIFKQCTRPWNYRKVKA